MPPNVRFQPEPATVPFVHERDRDVSLLINPDSNSPFSVVFRVPPPLYFFKQGVSIGQSITFDPVDPIEPFEEREYPFVLAIGNPSKKIKFSQLTATVTTTSGSDAASKNISVTAGRGITALFKKLFYLSFLVVSCTLEDQTQGLDMNEIIAFDMTQAVSVPANGDSTLAITVTLGADVVGEQEVTFKTDQGSFRGTGSSENQKEIKITTSLKGATAYLISDVKPNSTIGVTASVKSGETTFTITKQVSFFPAYASQLLLATDKQVLPPDQETKATITISAFRETGAGKVSDDLVISIYDSLVGGNTLVDIVPFVKTAAEKATFQVRSMNTDTGTVVIKARMIDQKTDKVVAKAERILKFKEEE